MKSDLAVRPGDTASYLSYLALYNRSVLFICLNIYVFRILFSCGISYILHYVCINFVFVLMVYENILVINR